MNVITLKSHKTGKIIFSGPYNSVVDCLEDAVSKKINLAYVDLRYQNLSNANLDDAHMPYANLTGCNLSGTNFSESILHESDFQHASLYNCYLSYSDLQGCNFRHSDFGATNIVGANIENCSFSTLSCFTLDFSHASSMKGCTFNHYNGDVYPMSGSPVVISGLFKTPVIIMDTIIKIGKNIFPKNDVPIMKILTHNQNEMHPPSLQHGGTD
ncbi:MAG: pentapeptide repeat-containing protein [Alphaproteobacteria bacterium]|nr:pentapeptide repeat-containing protein [Alphaproteobacteria bacterium]